MALDEKTARGNAAAFEQWSRGDGSPDTTWQITRAEAALVLRDRDERERRSWWLILHAGSREQLARVTARNGLDALSAYSEAEGFSSYIHPGKATDQELEEGLAAYVHEGKWHGTFTNFSILAEKEDP